MVADLVCFSHLRWDFVYQRPNHLMARAARERRVLLVEEPLAWSNAPMRSWAASPGRTWSQMSRLIRSADGDPAAGMDRWPLPRVAVAMGESRASVPVGARARNVGIAARRTQD